MAIDPAIGHEALKCVQTFLLRRNAAMSAVQAAQAGRNAAAVATAAAAADRESQDSFSEFFDDGGLNFEDPALDDLLGEAPQPPQRGDISTKITELKSKDREFAEVVRSSISPAIYRLVSNIYHPDRVKEGRGVSLGVTDELLDETGGTNRHQLEALVKEAERRQYVEIVIDCWVGCAYVMVQNGMKDWNSYLTLGNESWKRIDDPIGKRDVGLRFMQNIAVLDPAAYTAHQAEFICIWFQTAIARCLSIQDVYTTNLLELDPQHALFRNVPVPRDEGTGKIKLKLSTFERARLEILAGAFTNMRTAFDDATNSAESYKCRSLIISCLSGLLSAMRHYVEDPAGAATISKWQTYLEFCAKVVEKLRQEVGPTILRGIASELASVQALLKRQTGLGG